MAAKGESGAAYLCVRNTVWAKKWGANYYPNLSVDWASQKLGLCVIHLCTLRLHHSAWRVVATPLVVGRKRSGQFSVIWQKKGKIPNPVINYRPQNFPKKLWNLTLQDRSLSTSMYYQPINNLFFAFMFLVPSFFPALTFWTTPPCQVCIVTSNFSIMQKSLCVQPSRGKLSHWRDWIIDIGCIKTLF